tara:strand:+ start:2685 stop:3152 length:468 start_codon:yes stop_codon:yes gene_type:complete
MCVKSFSALDELEDIFGNAFGGEEGHRVVEVATVEGTRGILHIFQNDVVNVGCSGVLVESPIRHPVTPVRGGIAIVHATHVRAILLDVSLHLAEAVEQGSPDPSLLVAGGDLSRIDGNDHIADVVGGESGSGCCFSHACIVPLNLGSARGKFGIE